MMADECDPRQRTAHRGQAHAQQMVAPTLHETEFLQMRPPNAVFLIG